MEIKNKVRNTALGVTQEIKDIERGINSTIIWNITVFLMEIKNKVRNTALGVTQEIKDIERGIIYI